MAWPPGTNPNPTTDPQLAYRRATSIGPNPDVPARTGLTGLANWLISLGIPIYPEQEVTPLDLAAALPALKPLKALATGEKTAQTANRMRQATELLDTADLLYHGSPAVRAELQPGSMVTRDPTWAAGYTTTLDPIGMGERFTGAIHAVTTPSGGLVAGTNLHDVEGRLIEMARQLSGREPHNLREAAEIVAAKTGHTHLIAKKGDEVRGIIPLQPMTVEHLGDPIEVLKEARRRGMRIPSNLEQILPLLLGGSGAGMIGLGQLARPQQETR